MIALAVVKGSWLDPSTSLLRRTTACADSATFADNIHLCGYDVSESALHPGNTLRVTLYWQINRAATNPAYTFVHLLGSAFNPATNNPIWSQQDKQEPGTLPIQDWVTGKMIQDAYGLRVPPNTPPGDYQLEIGWYTPDGERLKPTITNAGQDISRSDLDSLMIRRLSVR